MVQGRANLEIIEDNEVCELPATTAMGFAMFDEIGIAEIIDRRCDFDQDQRILSPGKGVKALIGPMFDFKRKYPLCRVRSFYATAPVKELFGVDHVNLNDRALGAVLDTLAEADMPELMWDLSEIACEKFGLNSNVLHLDPSDFTVQKIDEVEDDGTFAVPEHSGHPKDLRIERRQYSMLGAVNGERILRYYRPFSGSTSDKEMDAAAIEFLRTRVHPGNTTIVADNKLVDDNILHDLHTIGFSFVSKLPSSYSRLMRDLVIDSACGGIMDEDPEMPGYEFYDTDSIAGNAEEKRHSFRFVACLNTRKVPPTAKRMRGKLSESAMVACDRISGKVYDDPESALTACNKMVSKFVDSPVSFSFEQVFIPVKGRYERRGRRPKDAPAPAPVFKVGIRASFSIDEDALMERARRDSMIVLITNLPRADNPCRKILRLYLDEYKVEHCYRLMKSGMGIDSMYLQTPKRVNAMMFVVAIATLIVNICDALLRRDSAEVNTIRAIQIRMTTVSVEYTGGGDGLRIRGYRGSGAEFGEYLRRLHLTPEMLSLRVT